MNISFLMVHGKHVEVARAKSKNRDYKREKSFDGGSFKSSVEIQDKPRLKKRVSNKVLSKFPKARDDRMSNPNPKKGKIQVHQPRSQLVERVARNTIVIVLIDKYFFCCCKSRHKAQYSQM